MELIIKDFYELTNDELLEIYKLRVSVFVVEQNCPYQEVDNHDKKAIHVYYKENDTIVAYIRVLPPHTTYDEASIGRVISIKRRCGLGTKIMKVGIDLVKERFKADKIKIGAQVYARKFYENLGFKQVSDEYIEDGIPHIKMLLDLSK